MKVNLFLVALLLCGLFHEYECFSSNQAAAATCFSSSSCRILGASTTTTTLPRSTRYPSLSKSSRLFAFIIDRRYETELRDKIVEEFKKGSEGVDSDGKQLFLPGITTVLSYPLAAQEAWILGVSTARGGSKRGKKDAFEPRYLKDRLASTIDPAYVKELKDRILQEFNKGSEGVDSDAKLLFLPGITTILSYPLAAQEAWIIGVSSSRKRGKKDVFEPRYLKTEEDLPKSSSAVKKLKDHATVAPSHEKELKDRIVQEFLKGSEGLDSDGKQLFLPGVTAVLSYPRAAQEAWIIGVSSSRGGKKNVFKPRYLKTEEDLPKSSAVEKLKDHNTVAPSHEKELKDRILQEFLKGSEGLDSDGKQLFLPGITTVLCYPRAAQEAWILGVSSSRGGKKKRGKKGGVLEPRYLESRFPKSIAVKKLTPFQWFQRNIFPGQ